MTKQEFDETGYKVGDNVLITYEGSRYRIIITDIEGQGDNSVLVTKAEGHIVHFPISKISSIKQ